MLHITFNELKNHFGSLLVIAIINIYMIFQMGNNSENFVKSFSIATYFSNFWFFSAVFFSRSKEKTDLFNLKLPISLIDYGLVRLLVFTIPQILIFVVWAMLILFFAPGDITTSFLLILVISSIVLVIIALVNAHNDLITYGKKILNTVLWVFCVGLIILPTFEFIWDYILVLGAYKRPDQIVDISSFFTDISGCVYYSLLAVTFLAVNLIIFINKPSFTK